MGRSADEARPETLPRGVALTAVAMARERQVESARADRLFDDPWAAELVIRGAARMEGGPAWLAEGKTLGDAAPGMTGYVALRTRWIDDRVLDLVAATGAAQVVGLGAGLDTRASRLRWPAPVRYYALDQPGVMALAEDVLAGTAPAAAAYIGTDLAGDWPADLRGAGFDPSRSTVWIVEGVLMYLTPGQVDLLVEAIRRVSAPGSSLVADVSHPNILTNAMFAPGRAVLGENGSPIASAVADPVVWLAERGWRARVADAVALAGELNRAVPVALDPRTPDGQSFWLVEAHRGG